MNETWSLDELYTGFDTPEYKRDFEALREKCAAFNAFAATLSERTDLENVKGYLERSEDLQICAERLGIYANLRQAVNTDDTEAMSEEGKIYALLDETAASEASICAYIAALPELDSFAEEPVIRQHLYLLTCIRRNAAHLLQPREEEIMAKLNKSGAGAWEQLWSSLTATVKVDFRGGTETLSGIRNLAYSPDAATRKEAYEAELRAYEQIRDSGAFAMNSIKLQTVNECKLRGYESVLDRSLKQSHMKKKTLDALLSAMEEYMPHFWRYLRAKGRALGHENGLPFYDLFAPMGKSRSGYTLEDTKEILLRIFGSFDGEMHDMMERAFDESWIDFFPHKGKVGGAFCAPVYPIRQSRVLTNFGGEFGDISTLAHELGHAFHNEMTFPESLLNQDPPMPLAETASTFNENLLASEAIRTAEDPQEKLALIENQLMDACQVICDIYSRFLFEKSVIEGREDRFFSADDLCKLMLDAQKKAYGNGLDPDALHPYMWLCKSHYYSGSFSYYNFPYAFGGLLARSLYAMYAEQGQRFVPKYKALLRATTLMDAEDAAMVCGIDLTDRAFWARGLQSYADEIDEYEAMLAK